MKRDGVTQSRSQQTTGEMPGVFDLDTAYLQTPAQLTKDGLDAVTHARDQACPAPIGFVLASFGRRQERGPAALTLGLLLQSGRGVIAISQHQALRTF